MTVDFGQYAGADLRDLAGPLALELRGCRVVGLAGPPGCGKSTLVACIADRLRALDPAARPLTISLDDVYYSRAERTARAIRFRAVPGSHDLDSAQALLDAVRSGARRLDVPRFDHATDDCLPPERVEGPVSTLLFEGLFVGMRTEGYDVVALALDFLIYLDCPTPLARRRRLGREARLRRESGGTRGFSARDMEEFWRDVLAPGLDRWVRPIQTHADLVIVLDDTGRVARVDRLAQPRP